MRALIALFIIFFSGGIFAQPALQQIASGTTSSLLGVSFISETNGFATVNGGTYLKTTNRGDSWASVDIGSTTGFHAIRFLNGSTGFMCGDFGKLAKTTNGGATWSFSFPATGGLYNMHFINDQTGYMVGDGSVVLRTVNGGSTWDLQSTPLSNAYLTDVLFIGNRGYVSVNSGSTNLLTTTNGGINWQDGKIRSGLILTSKLCFQSGKLYAVGHDQSAGFKRPLIFVSNDSGRTWPASLECISNSKALLYSVAVSPSNPNIAIAVGQYDNDPQHGYEALVRRTTNGGLSWSEEAWGAAGIENQFNSVTATNDCFIIVGRRGVILRTSQTVSVSSLGSEIPVRYELSQNYPNPFNPATKIRFSLPEASEISLSLFDMGGRKVTELAGGNFSAGIYEVSFNAEGLPSGTYFYKLSGSNFLKTKKMTLVK